MEMEEQFVEERSEEDNIIEIIKIEGHLRMYEDADFPPISASLYEEETLPPDYDNETIVNWQRPQDTSKDVCYFSDQFAFAQVRVGNLKDYTFLGALMAVCSFSDYDLMENIFASRPEDFVPYGVYTCRFYVDGEWVEVLTDTLLPCGRDDSTGYFVPCYSRGSTNNEFWIPLVEKAYAKAVGSYEAILNIKPHEALLHLTGGSVQQMDLHEHHDSAASRRMMETIKWKQLKSYFDHHTLVLAMGISKEELAELDGTKEAEEAKQKDANKEEEEKDILAEIPGSDKESKANDDSSVGTWDDSTRKTSMIDEIDEEHVDRDLLVSGRLYYIQCFKEIGPHKLVLVNDPYGESLWEGHWSENSSKWDDFPEVLYEIMQDESVKWSRDAPNGCFWLPFPVFLKHVRSLFVCKLFPNNKYSYYCGKGEWEGNSCGGPLVPIRPREVVENDYAKSKIEGIQKGIPPTAVDGDHSWFCNPQFRISCSKPESVYLSVVPVAASSAKAPVIGFYILATKKDLDQQHIWDLTCGHLVTQEAKEGCGKVKGQECSLWKFDMDPKYNYHVMPHCSKKMSTGAFVLRLFSQGPLMVESMEPYHVTKLFGGWSRPGVGEADLTGGPLMIKKKANEDDPASATILVENPKWAQNPQILLKCKDDNSKKSVHMKFVLRKADKNGNISHEKTESCVSLVVCKPDFLREANMKKKKAGAVRENALGVPLPSKPTSLKLEKQSKYILENMGREDGTAPPAKEGDIALVGDVANKRICKKISLANDVQYFQTSGTNKYDAALYFPSFPRQVMNDGLLLIPSLSEAGSRGYYQLEVYSSEEILLQPLPDKKMKVIAAEWDEKNAMGSHINPNWKKNPKYSIKFKPRIKEAEKFRICLHKVGEDNWKKVNRSDHIGSMIGFYVFSSIRGAINTVFESPYVPDREVATEDGFELEALAGTDDEYYVMPTTFGEQMKGSFVLSVMSDADFTLAKRQDDSRR